MPKSLPLIPPSFFAIVLGLAGLASAWRAAHAAWSLPAEIAELLYALALLVITVLYVLKWVVAPAMARKEAQDAVQCCFIGLAGVSTLLIAQGALPYSRPLAIAIFALGAGFTFAFGLWRSGILWRGGRDPAATTPVLYLPFVAGGGVLQVSWPQPLVGKNGVSWHLVPAFLDGWRLSRFCYTGCIPHPNCRLRCVRC
jgi:tellurite resistance protein